MEKASASGGCVPPVNAEAEQDVVGAMLLSAQAIETVREILGPDDFFSLSLGRIFEIALDLRDRDVPVDVITVSNQLERLGELDEVGGNGTLARLAYTVPAITNVDHYARIVLEDARRRRALAAAVAVVDRLYDGRALGEHGVSAIDALTEVLATERAAEQIGSTRPNRPQGLGTR